MAQGFIRIKSRPAGNAPAEIRDKWIGLVLPVVEKTTSLLADVMTGQMVTNRTGGYEILWGNAMEALASRNPETKEWWEKNVGARFHFPTLIFDEDCCEVVPD